MVMMRDTGSRDAVPGRRRVAVVVPLSDRADLTPDEEISLRHLQHYLAPFDKFAIVPEGSRAELTGCTPVHFPARYFGSAAAHARLLLSPELYDRFSDYEYVLTYHLDALVLSDRVLDWCDLGWDYIGSPWRDADSGELIVGNGGFALRRVAGFLRLLRSRDYATDPAARWQEFRASHSPLEQVVNLPRKFLLRFKPFNSVQRELRGNARMGLSDDTFIADAVPTLAPWFRIAPLEAALLFGFDNAPLECFDANGGRVPFGCHAWPRHRDFWEPYLLPDDALRQTALAG